MLANKQSVKESSKEVVSEPQRLNLGVAQIKDESQTGRK
jgi:hypothetical protein